MAEENIVTGNVVKSRFYSLDELAEAAYRYAKDHASWYNEDMEWRKANLRDSVRLAKNGWEAKLEEALAIAESAVEMVEKDHEIAAFQPVWELSGAEVDVARYLEGVPENMIEFPMVEISKFGKVITLCASVSVSGAVEPESIERRGQVICALALLLSRIGYASELWIAFTSEGGSNKKGDVKVLVKGTNDTLDPAKVMFAYAHPATLRTLMFAIQDGWPETFRKAIGVSHYGSRGMPTPPIRDLPEGTIYLPELMSAWDVPDAHEQLKGLLREIGLLQES